MAFTAAWACLKHSARAAVVLELDFAASAGIVEWESTEATVRSLQEYHRDGQLRLEV